MKPSNLKFIYLSLVIFAVCAPADERPKRPNATIPSNIHARIIQLEDERNLNGDELTDLLKHRSEAVRERAALAIGRIGDKRGTDALIAVLEHEGSEPARAMAAFALGEMEDARAVSALMAIVERKEESLSARARAVEALGKIAGVQANTEALGKPAVERINQSLITQLPDPQAALEQKPLASLTVAALMRIRSSASVEPLTRLLKSKGAEIRAQAANALARLRQPIDSAVPALIEALNDGDADVRANSARALGASKDARAVEPLIKLLDDESYQGEFNAVRALGALGDERAIGPLVEMGEIHLWGPKEARRKDDPIFNMLLEVATALGTFKDDRAGLFLVQLRSELAPKSVLEVEVATARYGALKTLDFRYPRKSWVGHECSHWKNAVIAAQVAETWAKTGDGADAEKSRELLFRVADRLNHSVCDPRGWPSVLRAIGDPKDMAGIWPKMLRSKDVIVKAAVATVLGEKRDDNYLQPLIAALKQSRNDVANDAKLAILTALSKYKSEKAVEAVKTSLNDRDHLVRRHAVDLLKQAGAGDFSDRIGIAQTGHDKHFYQRVAARLDKRVTATIHTTRGQIRIALFPRDAPITVDSFTTLARKGFFNNLTFHRVVPNFVIQGGDPRGDGEGGPGYQIRCEINTRPYTRGAVGMALSGKDTGGSQFFITHSPQPHLDGGYTVFGQVVSGMSVVDRISRGDLIRKVEIFESR